MRRGQKTHAEQVGLKLRQIVDRRRTMTLLTFQLNSLWLQLKCSDGWGHDRLRS